MKGVAVHGAHDSARPKCSHPGHWTLADDIDTFHGPDSDAIMARVLETVRPGDVVMVKGSLGSRMVPIARALRELGEAVGGAKRKDQMIN